MQIDVASAAPDEVRPLRDLYRQEMSCQIVHDSWHGRGWTDSYLLRLNGRVVGYGLVGGVGANPKDVIMEFYVLPIHRGAALPFFRQLAATSGARTVESQTNDVLLTLMLYECADEIESEKILFQDAFTTIDLRSQRGCTAAHKCLEPLRLRRSDARRRSPCGSERSLHGSERSPRGSERSPRGSERSPRGSERSPGGSERSPRGSERSPHGAEHSPLGANASTPGSRDPRTSRCDPWSSGYVLSESPGLHGMSPCRRASNDIFRRRGRSANEKSGCVALFPADLDPDLDAATEALAGLTGVRSAGCPTIPTGQDQDGHCCLDDGPEGEGEVLKVAE
jgi:hypothetical protein